MKSALRSRYNSNLNGKKYEGQAGHISITSTIRRILGICSFAMICVIELLRMLLPAFLPMTIEGIKSSDSITNDVLFYMFLLVLSFETPSVLKELIPLLVNMVGAVKNKLTKPKNTTLEDIKKP